MKDAIIERIEIGFDLCVHDNIIKIRNKHYGEETHTIMIGECGDGEFLGGFHTHAHQREKVEPSIADLVIGYKNGLECIGARSEIKCYLRYNFNKDEKRNKKRDRLEIWNKML